MKILIQVLLSMIISMVTCEPARFYVIREWKYLNFTWPSDDNYKTSVAKGLYIPENNVMAGVKYFDDYFYITLPRMKSGVPATLTRIKAGTTRNTAPLLEPYPSWEMNEIGNCDSLQNVQNIEIDSKGQMWIIDGGRIDTLTNPIVKCPPKLIIYDITTARFKHFYAFPEDVASRNGSFLYDIVVDNTDGGYAYITDNSAHDPGIVVFSLKDQQSWKIRDSKSMLADPAASIFKVNGIEISAPINLAGIALGPKIYTSNDKVVVNEDREVYFCPLSSLHLYSINTTVLRNRNLSQNHEDNIKDIGMKPSQSVGMIMDNQGILYYNLLGNNAIGRWDTHTPFQSGQRLIARDNTYMEWPNSFAFDRWGNLTVLMNRLNKFIYGKYDLNQANFRLITSRVGGESYLFDDNFNYHSEAESTSEDSNNTPPTIDQTPSAGAIIKIQLSMIFGAIFFLLV